MRYPNLQKHRVQPGAGSAVLAPNPIVDHEERSLQRKRRKIGRYIAVPKARKGIMERTRPLSQTRRSENVVEQIGKEFIFECAETCEDIAFACRRQEPDMRV
jgi:hypothetical protein